MVGVSRASTLLEGPKVGRSNTARHLPNHARRSTFLKRGRHRRHTQHSLYFRRHFETSGFPTLEYAQDGTSTKVVYGVPTLVWTKDDMRLFPRVSKINGSLA